jgi:UDP-2,3-diacylglucosamine hydrolase
MATASGRDAPRAQPASPPFPVPALVPGLDRVDLRAPVFISDLHLCARRPLTRQRFLALLEEIAGKAAELVILGDLFEFWAGDDTLLAPAGTGRPGASGPADEGDEAGRADDAVGREVAQALHRLGARGTAVYLMHGNRDLLLGGQFLQASGAQLLRDPAVARIGPGAAPLTALLAHGDAYCTLDVPYQAFRRQARNAQFQAGFLARPLEERRQLIGQARARSESGKQQMDAQIMDVTPEAIGEALRAAGVHEMIHGHTHRPARHEFTLDGSAARRWVLPDWDLDDAAGRWGGLRWAGGALEPLPV